MGALSVRQWRYCQRRHLHRCVHWAVMMNASQVVDSGRLCYSAPTPLTAPSYQLLHAATRRTPIAEVRQPWTVETMTWMQGWTTDWLCHPQMRQLLWQQLTRQRHPNEAT